MSNQRVLILDNSAAQSQTAPSPNATGRADVITVTDPLAVIAKAVAQPPDFVVLGISHDEALRICRQIMDYLPVERHPTFVICGKNCRQDNPRSRLTGQDEPDCDTANGIFLDNSDQIERISCHGLEMDRRKMRASIHRHDLDLTAKEFALTWMLASQPGHVHTRKQLLDGISRNDKSVRTRTIDQHVRAVRRKLGQHSQLVETVRGLGYRFRDCDGV